MASRNALAAGSVSSLAVIGLMLTACTTLRVGSDFDHTASFAGYHSFSWMPREHYGTRNPLVIQPTREAIQAELTRKGCSYVNEAAAADFVVDFTIGAHERTDVLSYPAPYGGPWYAGYGGWWGYPYWGNEVDVRQYREGPDIDHSEAAIRTAVAAVLEKFPPR